MTAAAADSAFAVGTYDRHSTNASSRESSRLFVTAFSINFLLKVIMEKFLYFYTNKNYEQS